MKCGVGCNLIHKSMNNGLNEVILCHYNWAKIFTCPPLPHPNSNHAECRGVTIPTLLVDFWQR